MQYLIYFYKDKQIVVTSADDVFLGEYEGYTLDDWRSNAHQECVVKVVYGGECYQACVLQVS